MSSSIRNLTAIVTGAASGAGRTVALHFIEQGARVVAADQDAELLKRSFDLGQPNARVFVGDLSKKLQRKNLLSFTLAEFERLDILVNASRKVTSAQAGSLDPEVLEMMLDYNLKQAFDMTRLALNQFELQQQEERLEQQAIGSVVNVSSIAGPISNPELLEYSISCAAQDYLSRGLSVILAESRIQLNTVALGSRIKVARRSGEEEDGRSQNRIGILTAVQGTTASSENLGGLVQFLASPVPPFVSGQVVTVECDTH